MILKGSQRGGGKALALHLMNGEQNEHVEVHEVKGFLSNNLGNAFKEAHAVSKGTHCKQYLFSLSLSPPEQESVPVDVFEDAIKRAEKKLGLEGQPRIVVFHEKEGRRHAHCVWSRINVETMKAVNMSHYKSKLNHLAKELYLENGWELPRGFMDKRFRDPTTYTLAEWQQARRMVVDPKLLKATLKDCWAVSDSKGAFINVLKERGFFLAQGDRRGFVAVNYKGEVLSLSRWMDVKAKEMTARLGDPKTLPTVSEVKAEIGRNMTRTLKRYEKDLDGQLREAREPLERKKRILVTRHKQERKTLTEQQKEAWNKANVERSKRLPRGFSGIWHRITGKYYEIRRQNEKEASRQTEFFRDERQALVDRQLEERRELQRQIETTDRDHSRQVMAMQAEMSYYMEMRSEQSDLKQNFTKEHNRKPDISHEIEHGSDRER